MKHIKVNIKGDHITYFRACAEAGAVTGNQYGITEKPFKTSDCVRVTLISTDGREKRVQKTFNCIPV
ncbi:MAG: hypothetical protein WC389_20290 [Lutibacter sp.]|jgi:hypothetical protein